MNVICEWCYIIEPCESLAQIISKTYLSTTSIKEELYRPGPPLPLMLMIKFPSISVQPLYRARDDSESMGGFSTLSVFLSVLSLVLQTIQTNRWRQLWSRKLVSILLESWEAKFFSWCLTHSDRSEEWRCLGSQQGTQKCDHFYLICILLCMQTTQSEAEVSYPQLLIG